LRLKWFALFLASFLPVYNATTPIAIGPGQVVTLWSAETPTPGNGTTAASQQVALSLPAAHGGFAIDGKFSGAPGVFEVDVQVAAVDSDTNYQTCGGAVVTCQVTSVDSVNNTFHVDCTNVKAKFVRLLMRTRANSVSITATITG
jgi:hypothetical protein